MKIAFVVHDYHRAGGHSRYVAELASRFSKDHEVHVFANRIEPGGASDIHFHSVPAWRANALTTVLTFALPAAFQIGGGFDIIHSQGFCGFRGNIFTGHICNRAWHLALQKNGGVSFRESIFNAVATTLEYTTYRFARHSAVVAISQRVADDLVRFYHCPAPIRVIHHGVDLRQFSPENRELWRTEVRERYGIAEEEVVFLYVGDLRKGAGHCIQALSRLEQGRLLFVSRSSPDAYREMADAAGLGNRVLFAGFSGEVERFYAAADAFLLPTPYDAFAMVVTEAMASGVPVIVSKEAGVSELIQHGVNGLLLNDVTSESELAGLMQSLAEDQGMRLAVGREGRKTVEFMSWDSVAEQTLKVYQELLENSN